MSVYRTIGLVVFIFLSDKCFHGALYGPGMRFDPSSYTRYFNPLLVIDNQRGVTLINIYFSFIIFFCF